MNTDLYIVVDDTELNEGTVVSYVQTNQIRARGGTVLPYETQPDGPLAVPMSGYAVRRYGNGFPLDAQNTPRVQSSLGMYLPQGNWYLHYAARVQASKYLIEKGPEGVKGLCSGSLVLAADQRAQGAVGFAPVAKVQPLEFRQFLPMDANGGWNLTGKGEISVQKSGFHLYALYGLMRVTAPNTGPNHMHMGVPWMAISATRLQ